MLKQFNKIKFLGLITIIFLISCAEEEAKGPASFDNFTAFATMDNYRSPVFDDTTLHLVDNGSIMSHDKKIVIYNYVEQYEGDNSKAIYNARLPKGDEDRFFVVQILGVGNSKVLQFIFDGGTSGGYYWNYKKDIQFKDIIKDNISLNNITFFDLAPKTKYIYSKDDSYINLLQSGTIVYYHDEKIVIFEYDSTRQSFDKNRAIYKAEGDNYLGVDVIGEGDNKDLKFYFDKKNNNDNESLFWTELSLIAFDDEHSNADVFPIMFIDNARKFGYQFALEDKGVNLHDNGTIMNSSDTKALFTYKSQPNISDNTKAIYEEVNSGKLIGIKIAGDGYDNRSLEAYFKNVNGVAGLWDNAVDVKYVDNDTSMLATRLVGMERGTPKIVSNTTPADSSQISTHIVDNIIYVLSQIDNDIKLSYTTSTSDDSAWESSITAGYKVMASSLQSVGKDLFATVIKGGDVQVLKLKPGLSPLSSDDGSSYINVKNSKTPIPANSLVSTADNNTLYIASSNGTDTTISNKDGTVLTTAHDHDKVTSLIIEQNNFFTAGIKNSNATVYTSPISGGTVENITGSGLPTVATNISITYARNNLYAVVTTSTSTEIYKHSKTGSTHTWTKQTLPTITGVSIGAVKDVQLISKGDNLYYLYKTGTQLVITPLRIKEDNGLAFIGDGKNTSIKIDISNLNVIAGITIVDNSTKIDPINADTFGAEPFVANPDKFLPTGDIYLSYVSSGNKLEVIKINMEDHGAFKLPN